MVSSVEIGNPKKGAGGVVLEGRSLLPFRMFLVVFASQC